MLALRQFYFFKNVRNIVLVAVFYFGCNPEVPFTGQVVVKVRSLEQGANFFTLFFTGVLAKPRESAAVCFQNIHYNPQQGGFTTSIRPQNAKHGTFRYFERHVIKSQNATV